MTLSHAIDAYVRHRRSLGVYFHGEQVRLTAFLKTVGDGAIDAVSPSAVRQYLDGRGPVTHSWFSRYHTLNAFYRFAIRREYVTASPLPRTKPQAAPEVRAVPVLGRRDAPPPRRRRGAVRRGLARATADDPHPLVAVVRDGPPH